MSSKVFLGAIIFTGSWSVATLVFLAQVVEKNQGPLFFTTTTEYNKPCLKTHWFVVKYSWNFKVTDFGYTSNFESTDKNPKESFG